MKQIVFVPAGLVVLFAILLAGCAGRMTAKNPPPEDTPPAEVEHEQDGALVKVEHPEQFPIATASRHATNPELSVTGVVSADVSRSVPVVSMSSGRIVEIRARLGRHRHQGSAPDARAKRRHRRRILGLPAGPCR